jgi:glucose 1-dehydrogenase
MEPRTRAGRKGLDGFMGERYPAPADRLVKVDAALGASGVRLEPTSIVAKAWALVDHAAQPSAYRPRSVPVTGAGPVGLLAALLGTQRGLDVHVLDRVTDGPKRVPIDEHHDALDRRPGDVKVALQVGGV